MSHATFATNGSAVPVTAGPVTGTSFPLIARLISQNEQWAADVKAIEPDFFERSAMGQAPKVLWIGCSDSRVPETVKLAAKPGEIFVHRNIANQFHPDDDSALSVLTYAIENLGVEHVIVCGHTSCGGVAASYALSNTSPAPEPTAPLIRWLTPLVHLAQAHGLSSQEEGKALPRLLEASVKQQVRHVVHTDIVQNAWKKGRRVWVHGWVYEVGTGLVRDMGCSVGPQPE
ncbi:carbonic anhydrase [Calocera viscosa TUFC12733]|uniref:Carbonic anhydrase n=1 Tax=Calocera viscosa (strain TUFC12733) TaxID=1330018 RepID=A0A167NG47_CALVF|nr:carbonic anhydrase [Calocera viscosa TUFC12733]